MCISDWLKTPYIYPQCVLNFLISYEIFSHNFIFLYEWLTQNSTTDVGNRLKCLVEQLFMFLILSSINAWVL
jgi:hypothetical protein